MLYTKIEPTLYNRSYFSRKIKPALSVVARKQNVIDTGLG
jgi:hypothetical protein